MLGGGGVKGEEKDILLVGGACGIVTGAFVVAGLGVALTLTPSLPWTTEQSLVNFPKNETAILTSYRLAYIASLLFIVFLVGLYRAARKTQPAAALIATAFGIVAAALTLVNFLVGLSAGFGLAQTYATATPSNRFAVVVAAQAVQEVLSGLSAATILSVGVSFIAFGLAMRRNPDFQKALGWVSVVLGVVVFGLLYAELSSLLAYPVIAIFAIVFGAKLVSLSRVS